MKMSHCIWCSFRLLFLFVFRSCFTIVMSSLVFLIQCNDENKGMNSPPDNMHYASNIVYAFSTTDLVCCVPNPTNSLADPTSQLLSLNNVFITHVCLDRRCVPDVEQLYCSHFDVRRCPRLLRIQDDPPKCNHNGRVRYLCREHLSKIGPATSRHQCASDI